MQQTSDERGASAVNPDRDAKSGGMIDRPRRRHFCLKWCRGRGMTPASSTCTIQACRTRRREGHRHRQTVPGYRPVIEFCQLGAATPSKIKEQWYCTSLQSAAGTRKAANLRRCGCTRTRRRSRRSGSTSTSRTDDPSNYGTIEEAWAAFSRVSQGCRAPPPSAVVKSGGGLHIYWISDTPMPPDEWAPYAHGLKTLLLKHGVKCDAGLTTDDVSAAARAGHAELQVRSAAAG